MCKLYCLGICLREKAFCNSLRNKIIESPGFLSSLVHWSLFFSKCTNEFPSLSRIGLNHFQEQFSVNAWVGIVGDLIKPQFLLLRGTISKKHLLPELLEDGPLRRRNRLWYTHNGAPPHFSLLARQFVYQNYCNRWIERAATITSSAVQFESFRFLFMGTF